jgi:CBS domain-containing protein
MNYKAIEVYTSEDVRWRGKPVFDAILAFVRGLKVAARCTVTRGIAGCYENGEVATSKLEILSFKMPLKIEIVLPVSEMQRVLPTVQEMVVDGIVSVSDLNVVSHRTRKHLIPRHLRVRDVMTPSPERVSVTTSASDCVRTLLSGEFNSLPVVDDLDRPIGIITQGDLISRGGMPVRLGLMEQMGQENLDAVLREMANTPAKQVMTSPVVTISEDKPLSEAVDQMLKNKLKRLPVVDAGGKLVGVLARLDVFRTITTEMPDWKAMQAGNVVLADVRVVRDILRPTQTVLPEATLEEVMRVIDSSDIQRVAVVADSGKFLGLISDHDLLRLFSGHKVGIWDRIASKLTFTDMGQRHKAVVEEARKRTAGEIMKTDLIVVGPDTPIDEAIRLMTAHEIKRLPVVDPDGAFLGMVSRDSLLRAAIVDVQQSGYASMG